MTTPETPFTGDGDPDQPHPHHILPKYLQDAIGDDPIMALELSETVLDGDVPLPYVAQLSTRFQRWEEQIQTSEFQEATAEIATTLAECQQAYPGSGLWDGYRSFFARQQLLAGNYDDSVTLVAAMQSPHTQATLAVGLAEMLDITGQDGQAHILDKVLDTYTEKGDHAGLWTYIRALADAYIDSQPLSPVVQELEALLAQEDVFFDPLESWQESQKIAYPDLDWDTLGRLVGIDEHWADVPFTLRRSIAKQYGLAILGCTKRSFEEAAMCMATLNEQEIAYPNASIWSHLRISILEATTDEEL